MPAGVRNRILDALDAGTCPIADCREKPPSGSFLCREHWRQVPDLLKSELREAARARSWRAWIDSAVAVVGAVEADGD